MATNPAVVAVFARALTTFSQNVKLALCLLLPALARLLSSLLTVACQQ